MFSRKWRAYLSLSLLFPHFSLSLSLSHALARARGRHPVAFRLYLSATGCLCLVAQPLYIKRQGACYSPLPSSRANYVGLANVARSDSIVRIRANLLSNRYHVAAPLFTSALLRMRSPFASPSFSIRFRRLFLQSSFIVPRVFATLRRVFALSSFLPSFFVISPPSPFSPSLRGSSTLDRSDGRWLQSYMPLSLKVTKSFSFLRCGGLSFLGGKSPAKTFYYFCAYNMYAC